MLCRMCYIKVDANICYSVLLFHFQYLQGSFRVYGAKASRQVFLFEKDILISKKKEGGMLGCKAQVQVRQTHWVISQNIN